MSEEKTEAPTAKKKKESRKEGQVPRTQELGGWVTLLALGLTLDFAAGRELRALEALMSRVPPRRWGTPTSSVALELLGRGSST